MTSTISKNICESIEKIESGNFDYAHVSALFTDLRALLIIEEKTGYEILFDIFDHNAHKGKRDKGIIFNESKRIIEEFLTATKSGGTVNIKNNNPNLEESFEIIFKKLQIKYNKNLFNKQISKIKGIIYNRILKDTIINVNNNEIESCSLLQLSDGFIYLSFKMKPFSYTHNGLTITGAPTMKFKIM